VSNTPWHLRIDTTVPALPPRPTTSPVPLPTTALYGHGTWSWNNFKHDKPFRPGHLYMSSEPPSSKLFATGLPRTSTANCEPFAGLLQSATSGGGCQCRRSTCGHTDVFSAPTALTRHSQLTDVTNTTPPRKRRLPPTDAMPVDPTTQFMDNSQSIKRQRTTQQDISTERDSSQRLPNHRAGRMITQPLMDQGHMCRWETCTQTFPSAEELQRHVEGHAGRNQPHYYCQWKHCTRKDRPITKRNKMFFHIRLHTDYRPLVCPNCSHYRAKRKESLDKHMHVCKQSQISL
jgi:hypothetical protein